MRTHVLVALVILIRGVCYAEEPKLIGTLQTNRQLAIRVVALSQDGRLLASAGDDGCVTLWNMPCCTKASTFNHGSVVLSVAFAGNGEVLASGGQDGVIKVWRIETGANTAIFRGRYAVKKLEFIRDKKITATYPVSSCPTDGCDTWDITTGQPVPLGGYSINAFTRCLSLRYKDGMLAWVEEQSGCETDSSRRARRICILENGYAHTVKLLTGHKGTISCLTASPTGHKLLASGSDDGTIKLWDVDTEKCIATWLAHQGEVCGAVFCPCDCLMVSCGTDGTIKVWRISYALSHPR